MHVHVLMDTKEQHIQAHACTARAHTAFVGMHAYHVRFTPHYMALCARRASSSSTPPPTHNGTAANSARCVHTRSADITRVAVLEDEARRAHNAMQCTTNTILHAQRTHAHNHPGCTTSVEERVASASTKRNKRCYTVAQRKGDNSIASALDVQLGSTCNMALCRHIPAATRYARVCSTCEHSARASHI